MKAKKLMALLLSAVMVMSAAAGCGSASDSKGKESADNDEVVELEFWGWWSSEARKPYIQEMVDGFNESQDKYRVKYVDIPWGDIFTKNTAQIAAGKPCDIIANSMEEVQFRASEGQVESLDEYLTDDVKDAFYSQYMEDCTGEDGSVYALPYSVDTRAIYYNKAHFEEAGIKPEDIQTWSDLEEAAKKLDKKNGEEYERVGFLPLLGNNSLDTWIINANGGQGWFNEESLEVTVDTETNKEAFKWVRSQIERYGQATFDSYQAAFNSGMTDPFASGKMSMLIQTSAYTSSLAQTAPDLEYGVIPFPEFKEGTGHVTNGGGFVLEIPKGAKCPEGSYEFIKYATSKETQEFLSSKMGDFSARVDFDENSEFYQNPINQDLAKCLENTATIIVPNELKGYNDVINPLIEEGTLGIVDTDTALANGQKALEDFVASNK